MQINILTVSEIEGTKIRFLEHTQANIDIILSEAPVPSYMEDVPVFVVDPEIVVWQNRSHSFPNPRN